MKHLIFQKQQAHHARIAEILDQYSGKPEWVSSQNAFHEILKATLHGGTSISKAESDVHFRRALTITHTDVKHFRNWTDSLLDCAGETDYYLVRAAHTRHDQYFEVDQKEPIEGTGKRALHAKFEAKNLYQRMDIKKGTDLPERVKKTAFGSWEAISHVLGSPANIASAFCLTHPGQADEVYAPLSDFHWDQAVGELFIAPDLGHNTVFSPALFAVFLFVFYRFSVMVSHLKESNIALTQRVAILEYYVRSGQQDGRQA